MTALRRLLMPTAALLAAALAGCGGSGPAYTVSGTVTYDGKPVPFGFILFIPDAEKGNVAPGGGAPIRDGKYRTEAGKGVVGGPYRVRITGTDGVATTVGGEPAPEGRVLFEPYEAEIELPMASTPQDFEVPTAKR